MFIGSTIDPLDAWIDCFEMKPKWRILIKEAKNEIQRAWSVWDGDKGASQSMMLFFGWLRRVRPYFLTFRGGGDPWQRVHAWLREYEQSS